MSLHANNGRPGSNTIKLILLQHSLWLYFDALFDGLSEFKTVHICICHKDSITITKIDCEKLQVQTQIMNQNLAIILWHLCYGNISFIVFVPAHHIFSALSGPRIIVSLC